MYNFSKFEKDWKKDLDREKAVVLFIPTQNILVRAKFGDGMNLSTEDYEESEGINDYIYITCHDLQDSEFHEYDGGQLDFNNEKEDYYTNLHHFCIDSLKMVGIYSETFYVLSII